MSVPPECAALQGVISDLESEIDKLQGDLVGRDLDPREPRPNSSQKAKIGQEINKRRAELAKAKQDLKVCVDAHTPPPPADTTPRLQVPIVMVTQSIQTWDNRVRLIRNRPTAVRVFVESGVDNGFNAGAGPNRWPNVTGSVRVTDLDSGLVSGTIQPFNPGGAITAFPRNEMSIDSGAHSLNFRLPQSVLSGRRLEILAEVWVGGHYGEPGGWTALGTATVELQDRAIQEVTPILIIDAVAGVPAPTFPTYVGLLRRGAFARLPVPSFRVNPPITIPVFVNLMSVVGWAHMIAGLTTTLFIGSPSGGIRTGVVGPDPAGPRPVGGMGLPRFLFTAPAFVSVVNDDVFTHEMGHTHGLNHAVCRGDETWPFDDRLPRRTDEVGMHVEDGLVLGRGTAELMSYCGPPNWPSHATYNLIFDNPA